MEMEMKMGKYEKGLFVVEVVSRRGKSVKSSLESMISRSNLDDVIFGVSISPMKEFGNYILVDMIATPKAISAILHLNNVKRFMGSNQNPMPLTEAEVSSMF